MWVLANANDNDARLAMEVVSFLAALVLGILLTLAFFKKFAWLVRVAFLFGNETTLFLAHCCWPCPLPLVHCC